MPNIVGPLLPTFGLDAEGKKALKKAEQYLLGYGLAISVAKKFPKTAGPLGFFTGLNLQPGRGVAVKPAAIPLLYFPQPIGVMPPEYYRLPNSMGDPYTMGKLLLKKDRDVAIANQFGDDLHEQAVKREAKRVNDVANQTAYEREVFNDLKAERVPRKPALEDIFPRVAFLTGNPPRTIDDLVPEAVVGINQLFFGDAGRVLGTDGSLPAPGREGSGIAFNPPGGGDRGGDPEKDQLNALSEMNRLNPPDP